MKKLKRTYPTFEEYASRMAKRPRLCGGYRTRGNTTPSRNDIPLVSIVTVTYNAEKTLLRTLESVRAQTYKNIEHIIIDGGSTDGTLALIQANEDVIAYWRSERDCGIYDAFNKGVVLATGEYIGILNADDYYELNQLENAVAALTNSGAPFVHGDIILHGWQGQDVELLGDPHYEMKIKERMPSLHQVTTLCRKSVFEKYGLFSTQYRIAGDFDWYLRLANQGCIGLHMPNVRAHMTAGGVSTRLQRRSLFEVSVITWRHGLELKRVLINMIPRMIFPNGTPLLLSRLLFASRHPFSASLNIIQRCIVALGGATSIYRRATKNKLPILQAFVAARHITLNVHPLGLEWIYGVGLRSKSFINLSLSPAAMAADLLLASAGARRTEKLKEADVLIIDQKQAEDLCLNQLLERKTVLVTSVENSIRSSSFAFPQLDFGGVIGFGLLINPKLTLRGLLHE